MICLLMFGIADSYAVCNTDTTLKGNVNATIVGIESQDHCTFLLLKNDLVITNFATGLDTNPFLAGRFFYLSLDPENPEKYKSVLTLATTALATNTRVYAEFTSRTGRIDRFSLSTEKGP